MIGYMWRCNTGALTTAGSCDVLVISGQYGTDEFAMMSSFGDAFEHANQRFTGFYKRLDPSSLAREFHAFDQHRARFVRTAKFRETQSLQHCSLDSLVRHVECFELRP